MPNPVTLRGESGTEFDVDLDLATEGVHERIANGSLTVVEGEKSSRARAKKTDAEPEGE